VATPQITLMLTSVSWSKTTCSSSRSTKT
jgi:hypothetical protein